MLNPRMNSVLAILSCVAAFPSYAGGVFVSKRILPSPAEGLRTFVSSLGPRKAPLLSGNGKTLLGISEREDLVVWDLATGSSTVLPGAKTDGHIENLAVDPAFSKALISVSKSSSGIGDELVLWDLAKKKELFRIASKLPVRDRRSIDIVRVAPDFRSAATFAATDRGELWDLEQGKIVRAFDTPIGSLDDVQLSAAGDRAVSAFGYAGLVLWDFATAKPLKKVALWSSPTHIQVNPEFTRAIVQVNNGMLELYDFTRIATSPDDPDADTYDPANVEFDFEYALATDFVASRSLDCVLIATANRNLELWDPVAKRRRGNFYSHRSPILQFAADASFRRAIAISEGQLVVYDLARGFAVDEVAPDKGKFVFFAANEDQTMVWALTDAGVVTEWALRN